MKRDIFKKLLASNFNFNGEVTMDSRTVKEGSIFFAINSGNKFVREALDKGAFVVCDNSDIEDDNVLKVYNTVEFMSELASKYRDYIDTVIAITGSNGKTSVKDTLASMLDESYKTRGNYNNHIGLPYTILSSPLNTKYLVLELGMSALGEIEHLSKIARPDYSIIVNIGDSHIEHLGSRENIFKAKTEIIEYTKKEVIVNGEDEFLSLLNLDNVSKVSISNVVLSDKGTYFTFEGEEYFINLYGYHNALNTALCIKTIKEMGLNINKDALSNLKLSKMRFEIKNIDSNIIINDAYNSSPKSLKSSLETLDKLFKDKEKIIIIGDMLELGSKEIEYHKGMEDILSKIKFSRLYFYGDLVKNIKISGAEYFDSKEEIKEKLEGISNSVVFIKASRGMKLEEVLKEDWRN